MSDGFDVIIVGAGAAGLAATRALHESGYRVICCEAADRIGGRAHTDHAIFGVPFDMGAHWLHNESVNVFIDIGQSLGLDLYPVPDRYLAHGDTDNALWDEVDAIGEAMDAAAGNSRDTAMLELFRPTTPLSYTAALMHALSMGRDMAEISVKDWAHELEDKDWLCAQGFGTIVARNAGALPVSLSTPVSAITRTAHGVAVTTAQGNITAKAVIVTVSQGVLAAEAIRFDPPLENDRLGAIEAITMGTYNHVALKFAPDTLPVKPDTWVTYPLTGSADGVLRGGGFLCNASGSGLSVFETSGTFARELETAGTAAAMDHALDALTGIFGTQIRKEFVKGHAMQWGLNPLTRGSYSGAMPGQASLRTLLGRPHAGVIHFAGEATHPTEMATVSGAHKEGLRAAKAVVAQIH